MFTAPTEEAEPTSAPSGGGFTAPAHEVEPDQSFLDKADVAIGNIPSDVGGMLEGSAKLAGRVGKGVLDLPGDVAESVKEEWGGNFTDTPVARDIKTVGKTAAGMVGAIPGQIKNLGKSEEWINHPVGNALTAGSIVAPFLGGEEAAAKGAAGAAEEGAGFHPPEPPGGIPEEIFAKPEAAPTAAPEVPPAGGPTELIAAPLRGYSAPVAEAQAKTATPEFKGWTDKFVQMPGVLGHTPTVGGWKDAVTGEVLTEPSAIIYADPAQADAIAAKIGMGLGEESDFVKSGVYSSEGMGAPQQAVIKIDPFSNKPNGTVYNLAFKDPAALSKWHSQLAKFGIENSTLDMKNNSLILADVGDNLLKSVNDLADQALKSGELRGLNKRIAEIQFPGEPEYKTALGVGAGAVESPVRAASESAGEALRGASRPGAAPPVEKGAPNQPAGLGSDLENLVNQIKIPERAKAIPGQIKDFVNRKLAKPESPPVVAKYMKDYADQNTLKDIGASPMQIRALDPHDPTFPRAHAVAEWARSKHIVDPTTGPIGQREMIKSIGEEAGQKIGQFRDEASAGARYNMKALMNNIVNKVGRKYTYGLNRDAVGDLQKALETVANAEPTPRGLAEAATELNKDAQTAHGLGRAHGPYTEVADYISKLNNDVVRQRIGKRAIEYDHALIDFGGSKKVSQFSRMKGSKELSGRGGSVGSMTNRMYQTALDKVGYRAGAKVASGMADKITANPAIARSMADLFSELVNQVVELAEEKD